MKDALEILRNVHAEVKEELDNLKSVKIPDHGTHEQARYMMLELSYQDTLNDIHSAIRKMEILIKHLY